jgi:hypothetical protein
MANPSLLKLKDYDAGGDPAFSKQVEEANKQKEKQQAKKLRLKESDTRMDSLEAMPNKINSLLKQQEEYKDSKEMLDAVNAIRNKKVLGGVISKVIKAVKSSAKGKEAYPGESGSLRDLKDFEEILTSTNGDAVSFKQKQLDEIRNMDFLSEFVSVREQDDRIIQQAKELGYSRSKTKNILQGKKSDIEKLNKAYDDLEEKRIGDAETAAFRDKFAEGGSMLVPPEMGMEPEMPVDTFTPEEQVMAEESQVPDDQMEDDYMSFVLDESLNETEQEYLMNALEADSQLSDIFDKVVTTASEFSGAGEVKGPGDGVSDSIPARLSDGEFVITEEATSEIGADNLQTMMDDAERKASGGKVGYAEGGLLSNPYGMPNQQMEEEENRIEQSMLGANQMPSLMGGRR